MKILKYHSKDDCNMFVPDFLWVDIYQQDPLVSVAQHNAVELSVVAYGQATEGAEIEVGCGIKIATLFVPLETKSMTATTGGFWMLSFPSIVFSIADLPPATFDMKVSSDNDGDTSRKVYTLIAQKSIVGGGRTALGN